MPSVLICSQKDLLSDLASTLLGRGGVDRFKAGRLQDAKLLAKTTRPALVLLDRDLPKVRDFLEAFREEPATRNGSIAILAYGDIEPLELELLELGANAILRLPPDFGWEERLSKLLKVPLRQESRLPVQMTVHTEADGQACVTQALNLSVNGMLVESTAPLALFQDISFRFKLPDGSHVVGHGRAVRQAAPNQYGVEFVKLDHESKDAIDDYVRSTGVR
jgi:DNA-binding response OmpR family regulator